MSGWKIQDKAAEQHASRLEAKAELDNPGEDTTEAKVEKCDIKETAAAAHAEELANPAPGAGGGNKGGSGFKFLLAGVVAAAGADYFYFNQFLNKKEEEEKEAPLPPLSVLEREVARGVLSETLTDVQPEGTDVPAPTKNDSLPDHDLKTVSLAVPVVEELTELEVVKQELQALQKEHSRARAEGAEAVARLAALVNELDFGENQSGEDVIQKLTATKAVLEKQLAEREEFIKANIGVLEAGRGEYDKAIQMYGEFTDDLKVREMQMLEYFEKDTEKKLAAHSSKLRGEFEGELSDKLQTSEAGLRAEFQKQRERDESQLRQFNETLEVYDEVLASDENMRLDVQQKAKLAAALAELNDALNNDKPLAPDSPLFIGAWPTIQECAKRDPLLSQAVEPEGLMEEGLLSRGQLSARWGLVEMKAREAGLIEEGSFKWPILTAALARIAAWFMRADHSNLDGDGWQSLVASTGYYMDQGDLPLAVQKASLIKGEPGVVVQSWLNDAKNRLYVEQLERLFNAQVLLTIAAAKPEG